LTGDVIGAGTGIPLQEEEQLIHERPSRTKMEITEKTEKKDRQKYEKERA
jgi:hypothetical protein